MNTHTQSNSHPFICKYNSLFNAANTNFVLFLPNVLFSFLKDVRFGRTIFILRAIIINLKCMKCDGFQSLLFNPLSRKSVIHYIFCQENYSKPSLF